MAKSFYGWTFSVGLWALNFILDQDENELRSSGFATV